MVEVAAAAAAVAVNNIAQRQTFAKVRQQNNGQAHSIEVFGMAWDGAGAGTKTRNQETWSSSSSSYPEHWAIVS